MAVAAAVLDVPVLTRLDGDPFELIAMGARVVVDATQGWAEIWDC
jgi:predicted aconitase with swiveling domain